MVRPPPAPPPRYEALKGILQMVVAMLTIIGILFGGWVAAGGPVPISIQRHAQDILDLRAFVERGINNLRILTLRTRAEVLRSKVITVTADIHAAEDAIEIHKRSLSDPQLTSSDREGAARRIRILNDQIADLKDIRHRLQEEIAHTEGVTNSIPDAHLPENN